MESSEQNDQFIKHYDNETNQGAEQTKIFIHISCLDQGFKTV